MAGMTMLMAELVILV